MITYIGNKGRLCEDFAGAIFFNTGSNLSAHKQERGSLSYGDAHVLGHSEALIFYGGGNRAHVCRECGAEGRPGVAHPTPARVTWPAAGTWAFLGHPPLAGTALELDVVPEFFLQSQS